MSNTLITPSIIAKEAMMQLENNLKMGQLVYTDYKKEFVKVGDTISVRRPVKFSVTDGATMNTQDVVEGKFSLTVDKRKHVAWGFSTQDLTLTIEEYSERYIKPAMISLSNQIDQDLQNLYKYVWNWAGTPGQTINSFADFSNGPLKLDQGAVPQDPRYACLSPADWWGMVGAQTVLYNPPMVKEAFVEGGLQNVAGIGTYMSQNVPMHTVGTYSGAPVVSGTAQVVTYASVANTNYQTLTITGFTAASALKAGDVFTIAAVKQVNPVSKVSTGVLQQFVLLSDVTIIDATTTTTLTISPAIITSGAYQSVDTAPLSAATITWVGTTATQYPQNMMFHRNAFALVMVPLELPDSAVWKARETYKSYSVRVIKAYDQINDKENVRLDVLYGVKALYPDLATRVSGAA